MDEMNDMSASTDVAAVELWATRLRCPQIHSQAGQMIKAPLDGFAWSAVLIVRPAEDRRSTVRLFVHLHVGPDPVRAVQTRRDLQQPFGPQYAVVAAPAGDSV